VTSKVPTVKLAASFFAVMLIVKLKGAELSTPSLTLTVISGLMLAVPGLK